MSKIFFTFLVGIFLIGFASAALTTTLNYPNGTQQYKTLTFSATGTVTTGSVENMTLWTKLNSGSWMLTNTSTTFTGGTTEVKSFGFNADGAFPSSKTMNLNAITTGMVDRVGVLWDAHASTGNWRIDIVQSGVTLATKTVVSVNDGVANVTFSTSDYSAKINTGAFQIVYTRLAGTGLLANGTTLRNYTGTAFNYTNQYENTRAAGKPEYGSISYNSYYPSATGTFTNTYSSGDTVIWNVNTCASDGTCAFANSNDTISISTSAPTISVSAPTGIYDYEKNGGSLTLNFTANDFNINTTVYNYNGTNITVSPTGSSLVNLAGNLVDYYRLDETTGVTAYDFMNLHNGTSNGVSLGNLGIINNSYGIAGNDYVDTWDMQYTNGTIAFWFKLSSDWNASSSGTAFLFDKGGTYIGADLRGSGDGVRQGALRFQLYNGTGNALYSAKTSWTAGQWYHVAVVWGSSGQKIYINGALDNSSSYAGTYSDTADILRIGKSSNAFTGDIDEFAIFNKSLNSTEITTLYSSPLISNVYTTNITLSNLKSLVVYVNDSAGNVANQTASWDYKVFENSISYDAAATSGANVPIGINITYSTTFTGITAILDYNNTNYTMTTSDVGNTQYYSANAVAPIVSSPTNVSFHFIIVLTNSTGTYYAPSESYNQTVSGFLIDNCSSYTHTLLNLHMADQETLSSINGTIQLNVNIYTYNTTTLVNSYNTTFSYNGTTSRVCLANITQNYTMAYTIKFNSNSTTYFQLQLL